MAAVFADLHVNSFMLPRRNSLHLISSFTKEEETLDAALATDDAFLLIRTDVSIPAKSKRGFPGFFVR